MNYKEEKLVMDQLKILKDLKTTLEETIRLKQLEIDRLGGIYLALGMTEYEIHQYSLPFLVFYAKNISGIIDNASKKYNAALDRRKLLFEYAGLYKKALSVQTGERLHTLEELDYLLKKADE